MLGEGVGSGSRCFDLWTLANARTTGQPHDAPQAVTQFTTYRAGNRSPGTERLNLRQYRLDHQGPQRRCQTMQPFAHEPARRRARRDATRQGGGWCGLAVSKLLKQAYHFTPQYGAQTIPRHVMANELHQPGIAQALLQGPVDFERQALDSARTLIAPSVFEQVLDIDPEPHRQSLVLL